LAISGDLGPQKFIYALINFIHYAEAADEAEEVGSAEKEISYFNTTIFSIVKSVRIILQLSFTRSLSSLYYSCG